MKEILKEIGYSIEHKLKYLCGAPSPGKRIAFVVTVMLIGAVTNFYFLFSSIYNMGKRDAEKDMIKIEHIDAPILVPESVKDSIFIEGFRDDLKG